MRQLSHFSGFPPAFGKADLLLNILIVGAGKVGSTLAAYLSREDHNVTIIDQNDTAIHRASDTLDVMCIKGPGAAPSVLREAGVEDADLVLATTNLDEVNMLCALTAKRLGAKFTIARIRDLAYTDDLPALQKDLNIDAVINPEYATALEISRLLRFPAAANVDTFFRGKVEMLGIRVQEGDPMVGDSSVRPFPSGQQSVDPLLRRRAEGRGDHPQRRLCTPGGDKLYVTGSPKDLSSYLRTLGRDLPGIHSAFLIGGSRIAHYLSKMLLSMGGAGNLGGEQRGTLPPALRVPPRGSHSPRGRYRPGALALRALHQQRRFHRSDRAG